MTSTIETVLTTIITGGALWGVKEWRDTVKDRRKQKTETDRDKIETNIGVIKVEVDAMSGKEQRLDAKTEAMFARYEKRLLDLEGEVETLKTHLAAEQENRKLADISADVAHSRAGDAETKLRGMQGKLSALELEISAVSRESAENKQLAETRARHIGDLKARCAALETEVACLKEHDPSC